MSTKLQLVNNDPSLREIVASDLQGYQRGVLVCPKADEPQVIVGIASFMSFSELMEAITEAWKGTFKLDWVIGLFKILPHIHTQQIEFLLCEEVVVHGKPLRLTTTPRGKKLEPFVKELLTRGKPKAEEVAL